MAEVILENVSKAYQDVKVVHEVNLHIKDAEFMVIVGPSGCGKTTTLRMVAGLEEITSGTIKIGDRVVNNVAPKDRDIAMVFQNYALYPHMTVFDNMAFGLKLRKYSKAEIAERVQAAAKLLGLEPYLERKPKALSGGQRQRVAVGRAIVRNPKAFLFDEPLSNLDAKLRITTRAELKALHRRLHTTSIYVTHDQAEAMTLGDRICVMYNGAVQQVAPPMDVYEWPANRFVAGFLGTPPMNFLEGTVRFKDESAYFAVGEEMIGLTAKVAAKLRGYKDKQLVLGVRPESLSPVKFKEAGENTLTTIVNVVEPLGDRMDVYCSTPAGKSLIANIDPHVRVKVDERLAMHIDVDRIHLFEPGDTGINVLLG